MGFMPLVVALLATQQETDRSASRPKRRPQREDPTEGFDEIHIVVTEVQALRGVDEGSMPNLANEEGHGSSTQWRTLLNHPAGVDIDLLDTRRGLPALLGSSYLEAGSYSQLLVEVRRAYGMRDGAPVDLPVSDGVLRIVRPFRVEPDGETRIVLEMDPRRALRRREDGTWALAPAIGKTRVQVDTEDPHPDPFVELPVGMPRTGGVMASAPVYASV